MTKISSSLQRSLHFSANGCFHLRAIGICFVLVRDLVVGWAGGNRPRPNRMSLPYLVTEGRISTP